MPAERTTAGSVSRWGRLVERRAAALLGTASAEPALVVEAAGGFPVARRTGAVTVSTRGRARPGATIAAAAALPFASGSFAAVVDATRPEAGGGDAQPLAELVRVCRPGGTVALVARGGPVPAGGRTWATVRARLVDWGCEIERVVPFDALGPFSPWRCALGTEARRVLSELEDHLRSREVRRAARLLERRIVAALPPEQGGWVFVRARRHGPGRAAGPARGMRSIAGVARSRSFAAAVLRLMRDDAVVRFAAFLDAELLSTGSIPVDLAAYVRRVSLEPQLGRAAAAALLPRRRWWSASFDVQRFLAARGHRMARATIEVLRGHPDGANGGVDLADTLEYDLLALVNRQLERLAEAGESR
jgi:SAM-dependent methyltransferase